MPQTPCIMPFAIRYGETDMMGVVHHANYVLYGDKPVVRTRVAALTQMKVTFAYEIFESAEAMESGAKPNCSGQSVHCIVEAASFKPVSMKKAAPKLYALYQEALEA